MPIILNHFNGGKIADMTLIAIKITPEDKFQPHGRPIRSTIIKYQSYSTILWLLIPLYISFFAFMVMKIAGDHKAQTHDRTSIGSTITTYQCYWTISLLLMPLQSRSYDKHCDNTTQRKNLPQIPSYRKSRYLKSLIETDIIDPACIFAEC